MTDKYPDDCKEHDSKNQHLCKVFSMSCAMYHTMIYGRNGGKGAGICGYYEVTPCA